MFRKNPLRRKCCHPSSTFRWQDQVSRHDFCGKSPAACDNRLAGTQGLQYTFGSTAGCPMPLATVLDWHEAHMPLRVGQSLPDLNSCRALSSSVSLNISIINNSLFKNAISTSFHWRTEGLAALFKAPKESLVLASGRGRCQFCVITDVSSQLQLKLRLNIEIFSPSFQSSAMKARHLASYCDTQFTWAGRCVHSGVLAPLDTGKLSHSVLFTALSSYHQTHLARAQSASCLGKG